MRFSLWRVWTILRKDFIDAIKDARVLVSVLVPLGIGILYNVVFQGAPTRPAETVAYVAAETSELPAALKTIAGQSITLKFTEVPDDAEVRRMVEQKKADVGIIAAPGFDAAVKAGQSPTLTLVQQAPSARGLPSYTSQLLDSALRVMAGQRPVAQISVETLGPGVSSPQIFEKLGLREYFVIAALMMLVAMIALLAIPIIFAEEREKKTLDALVLVASHQEVLAATALVGIAYTAITTAILLGVTRLTPKDLVTFAAGVLLLSAALTGFGLLLGGLMTTTQLYSWNGFLLIPVIGPAFLVGIPGLPPGLQTALDFFPTSQATKLVINGMSGAALFGGTWFSVLVIVVWGAAAYGLLWWRMSVRRG